MCQIEPAVLEYCIKYHKIRGTSYLEYFFFSVFQQLLILIFSSSRFFPTSFFMRMFPSSKREACLLIFWTFDIAVLCGNSEENFSLDTFSIV